MLKVTCPDGIDLKFMDERNLSITVEDGELIVKNTQTQETVIRLEEGKWSNYVHVDTDPMIISL